MTEQVRITEQHDEVEAIPPGIEAGAYAHVALAMEAERKGDKNLLKSIARGLVRPAFLPFLSQDRFKLPQSSKEGKYVMVPFMDWEYAQMAMAEDPALADGMRSMRLDWSPEKWPNGGARYEEVYAKAAISEEYRKEFFNPDGSPRNRKYLAQILQAIAEDTIANVQLGGNSMVTFHNEIAGWAHGGRHGEGESLLPAKELVRFYVEMSRSAIGRGQLRNLLGSPAQVQAVNKAIEASGYTYFTDPAGEQHSLNIEEIMRSGEEFDRRAQALLRSGQELPSAPVELG